MKANFDIIQEKIKKHKSLNEALRQKKLELDSALEDAKEKRKNFTFYDKADYDREISALNSEREKLKKEISNIKVDKGYYYRVAAVHSVTHNGVTETTDSVTNPIDFR